MAYFRTADSYITGHMNLDNLAVNSATIGSNALAVTGSAIISGNVGIGTTSPGGILQAVGGVCVTSSTSACSAPGSGNLSVAGGAAGPFISANHAPIATGNYASAMFGGGSFAGGGAPAFTGSSSGTSIGVNEVSGYTGDFINTELAGVSKFKVDYTGLMTLAASTFVLGGHTCSIVATVLTCP